MSRLAMIDHLTNDVWVRLAPGSFGIGVTAIRDIPEGKIVDRVPASTMPRHMTETLPSTDVRMKDLQGTDPDVISYLKELNVVSKDKIKMGDFGANCFIGLSYFVNHADAPAANCQFIDEEDNDISFSVKIKTIKPVKKGEEVWFSLFISFFYHLL